MKNNKIKKMVATIKTLSWIAIVSYIAISLVIIIIATTYSIEALKLPINELTQNKEIIDYVATANNYVYSDVVEIMSNISDRFEFVLLEIIIPTIPLIFGYILIIITMTDIIKFVKKITSKKDLFTEEKYQLLRKIAIRTDFAIFCTMLNVNLIIWGIIGILLEIILYLFKYCIEVTNNKEK